MSSLSAAVSLHPYFQVRSGQMPAARDLLRRFVAKTETEAGNLYYGFTIDGDRVFCREAYGSAESVLEHLTHVGPELDEMLALAELSRLEVHGPSAELAKLRGALAALKPAWFECECGVTR